MWKLRPFNIFLCEIKNSLLFLNETSMQCKRIVCMMIKSIIKTKYFGNFIIFGENNEIADKPCYISLSTYHNS